MMSFNAICFDTISAAATTRNGGKQQTTNCGRPFDYMGCKCFEDGKPFADVSPI